MCNEYHWYVQRISHIFITNTKISRKIQKKKIKNVHNHRKWRIISLKKLFLSIYWHFCCDLFSHVVTLVKPSLTHISYLINQSGNDHFSLFNNTKLTVSKIFVVIILVLRHVEWAQIHLSRPTSNKYFQTPLIVQHREKNNNKASNSKSLYAFVVE